MFLPVIEYTYLAMIGLAFLFSFSSFRAGVAFHLKLFALLLGLALVVEVYASNLKNTVQVYGIFSLLEFWVYGYFFYQLIRVKVLRWMVFLFLWIFPILWLVTNLFLFRFHDWNSYVMVTGSFCSVLFALMYYYQLITAKEIQPIRHLPEFWIATGILMYYLWELPFFGTLNFFMPYYTTHRAVINGLLNTGLVLDTLMYALFSYGYLCLRMTNTTKSSSS